MLYAVSAIGITSLLLKWRLYQLRERNRRLEATVEERTAEIRRQRDQIKDGFKRKMISESRAVGLNAFVCQPG